jgi:hypothetical protein
MLFRHCKGSAALPSQAETDITLAEPQADPNQPGKCMDPAALEELTASVSQMGIIQPVVCRQDPTIPKTVRIEIARKKQERGMVTAFRKYQEQRDMAAARETDAAKRTRTEAIAHSIALTASKIDDLAFPSFTAEDRAILIEAMNALKDILEPAITRAVNNRGKAT